MDLFSHLFFMSPEAFLTWEAEQSWKHEYLNGETYAMAGGTLAHNAIALNVAATLKSHLRRRGCQTYMADAKVQVTEQGPLFYPDVVVTYDQRDRTSNQVIRYPSLVIEVLSPSIEGYDRGEKFRQYRRLNTLSEYVLISAETMAVEVFQLNTNQNWELTTDISAKADDPLNESKIYFSSIELSCFLSDIYEDVILPKPSEGEATS
jgi:Uma2 family endonuclease